MSPLLLATTSFPDSVVVAAEKSFLLAYCLNWLSTSLLPDTRGSIRKTPLWAAGIDNHCQYIFFCTNRPPASSVTHNGQWVFAVGSFEHTLYWDHYSAWLKKKARFEAEPTQGWCCWLPLHQKLSIHPQLSHILDPCDRLILYYWDQAEACQNLDYEASSDRKLLSTWINHDLSTWLTFCGEKALPCTFLIRSIAVRNLSRSPLWAKTPIISPRVT